MTTITHIIFPWINKNYGRSLQRDKCQQIPI